jgi:hypothetical protein
VKGAEGGGREEGGREGREGRWCMFAAIQVQRSRIRLERDLWPELTARLKLEAERLYVEEEGGGRLEGERREGWREQEAGGRRGGRRRE